MMKDVVISLYSTQNTGTDEEDTIDFSIIVQIGISTLDRLACLRVVELMIYIEHVWFISL